MKKGLAILMSAFLLVSLSTSCDTNEITDQAMNIVHISEEHVQSVKNGTSTIYPEKTWGEAFDSFFTAPTWKYFSGILEGPDENGDGKPDYTETDVDIVEFTGYCNYRGTDVKARVQFQLNSEDDSFTASFLAFNEVPQNMVLLNLLIAKAFGEDSEEISEIFDVYDDLADQSFEDEPVQAGIKSETQSITKQVEVQTQEITDSVSPPKNNNGVTPVSFDGIGQVFSRGGTIYGMTTEYVCNNGPYETQWPVEDTWHITIKNTVTSHGVTWYECWDTDDGDYYGWIDGTYIRLYSEGIQKSGNVFSIQYFDVNYDGTSEIFVKSGTCEAEYFYYVYSPLSEEKYEYLGVLGGSHSSLCTMNGYLYRDNAIQGVQNIYQIKMSGYDIYEECVYSGYTEPGEDYVYSGEPI